MPTTKAVRKAGGTTAKKPAKAASPKTAKKVTLDDVWATIDEIGKAHKELEKAHEETEKAIKATQKAHEETEKAIKEMSARVDRVTKNVGGLNQSLGELIEILVAARLWEKFERYPYNLKRAYQRVPLYDENNQVRTDIDILLADTEWVMAVEVKHKMDKRDEVDRHLKRMELIRKYPPAETVGKKLLGAMAGGVVDPDVKDYACAAGFFVLELAGESVRLIPPPEGFEPQQW